jgi:hypothetical protein
MTNEARPPTNELSPKRFEALLGIMSNGVFAIDAGARVSGFNRPAECIAGVLDLEQDATKPRSETVA